MGIRMSREWRTLEEGEVAALPGQLGVYQIGSADGTVLFIGMAGGRSLFGLRGELARELTERDPQRQGEVRFRVEVNMGYWTRYQELLMLHQADCGELPIDNRGALPVTLGRLSPA